MRHLARMDYTEPLVSLTEIFANKKTADDFEEVKRLRDKRKPAVSQRDNTISRREAFAAINRPGNPGMKETFTRITPENRAHLSSPRWTLVRMDDFGRTESTNMIK